MTELLKFFAILRLVEYCAASILFCPGRREVEEGRLCEGPHKIGALFYSPFSLTQHESEIPHVTMRMLRGYSVTNT